MKKPARIVYCYDFADAGYRQELEKHLAALHREQIIESWHEDLIAAGDDAQGSMQQQIRDADVLLLLISADFLASERCQTIVAEALLRHDDRHTIVCPVIVRPCDWRGAPLGGLVVLPPDGNPVTTRSNQDDAWLDVARGLRQLVAPPLALAPKSTRNPYRGLAAFQAEDQAVFFGREELTRQLWQGLQRLHEPQRRRKKTPPRIFAVLGPSGSGKSSLVRAGLVSALRQQPAWGAAPPQVVIVTPGEHPIERLAYALLPLWPQAQGRLDVVRLDEMEAVLRKASADGVAQGLRRFAVTLPGIEQAPLLLIVDQFEEVYAQCKDVAEQDLFVALLLHAAQGAQPEVSVVLTLRNDFLGETRRHQEFNQVISRPEAHALVPVMGREELRRAIALPAKQSGYPIDDATTERLLFEARDNETALPLLEFALTRIWEGMQAGTKPEATLHALGGVGGMLAGKAQAMYESLSLAERATAQRALVRLVQIGEGTRNTRRRAPLRELCGQGQTEREVLAVLRHFATDNARLVTLSGDGADTVAEVTHEALFEHWTELRNWINDSRADSRVHDRAAEAARLWDEDQRRPGRLWRRPDLDLLRSYRQRKTQELTPLQFAFLQAAEQQQQREKITRWGSVAAVCVALVVTVFVYLTKERQRASEERKRTREVAVASDKIRQQLLDTYVEQGRQLLAEKDNPIEAILWLHRAQAGRSANPALPALLRSARYRIEATHVVLVGHKDGVTSAAYSPDGQRIVTASGSDTIPNEDNTARVWDADMGRQLAELKGHTASVTSANYRPDGKRIVTASKDNTARVWDADTGRQLVQINNYGSSAMSAKYSPDGKRIVTASWDGTARVWDAETGRELATFTGHQFRAYSAIYSPDSRRILTASADNMARVWDTNTGRPLVELNGHENRVMSAAYSPDGKHIVTASEDKTARIWDAETGKQGLMLKGHESSVMSAAYSPDGQHIVTASEDKTARIWDANTGNLVAELKGHGSSVMSARYSPDGQRIVTASADKTARVWKIAPAGLLAELSGHGSGFLGATYSPNGKRIVTAGGDKVTHVWDADTGRPLAELKDHPDTVMSATYSPDSKRIVTVSHDWMARIWDADTGRLLARLKGHSSRVRSANYSPDGKRIVTASDDNTARFWDAETGLWLALKEHDHGVVSATYSPDGKRIVIPTLTETAQVWDAAMDHQLAALKGHTSQVLSATYSPDGKRIVTASRDTTARIWDADTGYQLLELKGHTGNVTSAMYSRDGKRIVTASEDHTARIWDADTGHLLAKLTGHRESVYSATYSPDGKRVLTASWDTNARIWDASAETQSADQIAQLIRCKVGARFAREDGTLIVPVLPDPSECMPSLRPTP